MAYVKISAWEIAEAFGLSFDGEQWDEDKHYYVYKFSFHDKQISHDRYFESDEDVKEDMAERLLLEMGKHLSKVIGDI